MRPSQHFKHAAATALASFTFLTQALPASAPEDAPQLVKRDYPLPGGYIPIIKNAVGRLWVTGHSTPLQVPSGDPSQCVTLCPSNCDVINVYKATRDSNQEVRWFCLYLPTAYYPPSASSGQIGGWTISESHTFRKLPNDDQYIATEKSLGVGCIPAGLGGYQQFETVTGSTHEQRRLNCFAACRRNAIWNGNQGWYNNFLSYNHCWGVNLYKTPTNYMCTWWSMDHSNPSYLNYGNGKTAADSENTDSWYYGVLPYPGNPAANGRIELQAS